MAGRKVFSEKTKSKLSELYGGSANNIISKNAVLDIYNVPITFNDIINKLKSQPFISTVKKSAQLDFDSIDFEKINGAIKNIGAIPKSKETAVIEVIQAEAIPQVKFMHSEMIKVANKMKFAAPRFTIDLSRESIGSHCGVRINTGYIIRLNNLAIGKTISKGEIIDTTLGGQPDFLIIPQIVSQHEGLIQCLYGRDPEDTGLLTINFTTTKPLDTSKPLQVVLNAYVVGRPLGMASIYNSESTNDLFKAKDNRSGRWVKNPKTKFLSDKFDLQSVPGSLLLTTFNSNKSPIVYFENQKLKIDKIIALFTSRKREWCDPNLITFAGIYNPFNNLHSESMVVKCMDVKHNTHGIVFIKNKITVFSIPSHLNEDCKILNGSFYNLPSYSEINRDIRKVTSSLIDLSIGANICKSIEESNPELKFENLIRVFDYERSIAATDVKLASKVLDSEEKLFNERSAELNCYSVNLYNGLKSLAYHCCNDRFNDEQLKMLSMSCSKSIEDNVKRSLDEDDEFEKCTEKRIKLE